MTTKQRRRRQRRRNSTNDPPPPLLPPPCSGGHRAGGDRRGRAAPQDDRADEAPLREALGAGRARLLPARQRDVRGAARADRAAQGAEGRQAGVSLGRDARGVRGRRARDAADRARQIRAPLGRRTGRGFDRSIVRFCRVAVAVVATARHPIRRQQRAAWPVRAKSRLATTATPRDLTTADPRLRRTRARVIAGDLHVERRPRRGGGGGRAGRVLEEGHRVLRDLVPRALPGVLPAHVRRRAGQARREGVVHRCDDDRQPRGGVERFETIFTVPPPRVRHDALSFGQPRVTRVSLLDTTSAHDATISLLDDLPPRQVWIFEPGALFLLGVFPTQLIRHKVKMLTNPTRNSRFPFKAALRESPTTYLAHKATRARVVVVVRVATTRRS